jgi:hypothetical protein
LAADLATRHGSRLTALYGTEWSRAQLDRRKSAELGLVSVQGLTNLDRHVEASIDAMAQRLRSTLDELTRGHGVEAELRSIDGVAAEAVPQFARYADVGDGPPLLRRNHCRNLICGVRNFHLLKDVRRFNSDVPKKKVSYAAQRNRLRLLQLHNATKMWLSRRIVRAGRRPIFSFG